MNNEEPDFIYGCGNNCVFRFPKVIGIATNIPCDCVRQNMTQLEAVELRKKIRDLVSYAAVLRSEHKQRQETLRPQKYDPNEIILGC